MSNPYSGRALTSQPRAVEYTNERPGEPHLIIELRKSWTSAVRFPVTMWAPSSEEAYKEMNRRQYGNYVALFNIESKELVTRHHVMTELDKQESYSTFQLYLQEKTHMLSDIWSKCQNKLGPYIDMWKYYHQEVQALDEACKKNKEAYDFRMSQLEKSYKDMEEKVQLLNSRELHLEAAREKDNKVRMSQLEKSYKDMEGCYRNVQRSVIDLEEKCEEANRKNARLEALLVQCEKSSKDMDEHIRYVQRLMMDMEKKLEKERTRAADFENIVSALVHERDAKMKKSIVDDFRELREKIKFLETKVYKECNGAQAKRATRAPSVEGCGAPSITVSAGTIGASSVKCSPPLSERDNNSLPLRPGASEGPSLYALPDVGGSAFGHHETHPSRRCAALHESPAGPSVAPTSTAALSSQKVISTDPPTTPTTPTTRTPVRAASVDKRAIPTEFVANTTKTPVRGDFYEKRETPPPSTTTVKRVPVSDNSVEMRQIVTSSVSPGIAPIKEPAIAAPASAPASHRQRTEEMKLHSNATRHTVPSQASSSYRDPLIEDKATGQPSRTPERLCTDPEECPSRRAPNKESDGAPSATIFFKHDPPSDTISPQSRGSTSVKLSPTLSERDDKFFPLPAGATDGSSPRPASGVERSPLDSHDTHSPRRCAALLEKPVSVSVAPMSAAALFAEKATGTVSHTVPSTPAIKTPVHSTSVDKRAIPTISAETAKITSDESVKREAPSAFTSTKQVMKGISPPFGIPGTTSIKRPGPPPPPSTSSVGLDRQRTEEEKLLSNASRDLLTDQSSSSIHNDVTASSIAQPKSAKSNPSTLDDDEQIQSSPTFPKSNPTTPYVPRNAATSSANCQAPSSVNCQAPSSANCQSSNPTTPYVPRNAAPSSANCQSSMPRGTGVSYPHNCPRNSQNPSTPPQQATTQSSAPAQSAGRRVASPPARQRQTPTQARRDTATAPRRPKLPSTYNDQAEAILLDWEGKKPEDRKKEYKQLLKKWHPDKVAADRELATEITQWLNSAETKKYLQMP